MSKRLVLKSACAERAANAATLANTSGFGLPPKPRTRHTIKYPAAASSGSGLLFKGIGSDNRAQLYLISHLASGMVMDASLTSMTKDADISCLAASARSVAMSTAWSKGRGKTWRSGNLTVRLTLFVRKSWITLCLRPVAVSLTTFPNGAGKAAAPNQSSAAA